MSSQEEDPLLRALRELPRPAMDASTEDRARREARAAFVRATRGSPWYTRFTGALVPVALATVVGIYLTWAIGAASSLFH
jgi:hypothetical protein